MGRMIPQTINDVNVFVDGKGYLGVVDSIKMPDIVQETVEAKGAITAKYATGAISAMEISFKLSVLDLNLFNAYGLNSFVSRVPLILKANIKDDNKQVPLLAAITGDFEAINVSDLTPGNKLEVEIKMQVHFYSLAIDNAPLVLIDTRNMICIIGGVDYLAQARSNLQ
jgi:P2 family phage contractile tail tube protein